MAGDEIGGGIVVDKLEDEEEPCIVVAILVKETGVEDNEDRIDSGPEGDNVGAEKDN